MIVFWVIAVALVAAALLFILPPLLRAPETAKTVERDKLTVAIYKDQLAELESDLRTDTITREQYEQGRMELERRLLEDVPQEGEPARAPASRPGGVWTAVAVGIAVPLAAVALYLMEGNMEALKPPGEQKVTINGNGHGESAEQIMALIQQLEARLEKDPNDAKGWAILGRSYLVLEQFPQSVKAFAKAVALNGSDPQLLVDYADALAMSRPDKNLEGKPLSLVDHALKLDPNNQKGLWLAGTAAFDRHDYQSALKYWQKLYALVPADSDAAKAMESNITEVRARLSSAGGTAGQTARLQDEAKPSVATAAPRAVISGEVRLSPELQHKVKPDDVVYIFARAPPGGPPMPLAIERVTAGQLPAAFTLDDSKSIMPSAKLSDFSHAVIGARVSKSGDAMAHSGDLQGMSQVVAIGSKGVNVVIDTVVP